jgi:hypothetical protein
MPMLNVTCTPGAEILHMSDFPTDVDEFEKALELYKQRHGRMFPTCSEILEVARDIGFYRQCTESEAEADADAESDEPQDAENLAFSSQG